MNHELSSGELDGGITAGLDRLRAFADVVGAGWKPRSWRIVDEGGNEQDWDSNSRPDTLSWIVDALGELDLTPHERLTMRTTLDLPDQLFGVPLTGDRLEMTVRSLYPTEVSVDGQTVLAEETPPVATGPALIEVVDPMPQGWAGELELVIAPLEGQRGGGVTWIELVFRTPGMRARFDRLDLAWAQLFLASRFAESTEDIRKVAAAVEMIPADLESMAAADIDRILDSAVNSVAEISARASSTQVHVIGHSHIDLAWLWTWEDTKEVIKRDVRSVLSIMDDYPEATFTHSQPAGYEVLRTEEPELFHRVVDRISEGRWEPATAQWVECDTNIPSGEALAIQLREGVRFSEKFLGGAPRVLLAPDTFGHSGNIPQLARSAGVEFYYHMRCNPGADGGERWPAYWWEGIDGTRILAFSTEAYNGSLTAGAIARAAAEAHRAGLDQGLLFVGVGDHGGAPTRQGFDTLRRLADIAGLPVARCSTVAAYGDAVLSSGCRLPIHRGESPRIFEGCYTTHADVKRTNRDGENALVTTETLAAMAGIERSAEMDNEWRHLCLHQFHDIICGSSIPEVYEMTAEAHRRLESACAKSIDRSIPRLVGERSPGVVAVTNPHAYLCREPVMVENGGQVPAAVRDSTGRVLPVQEAGDGRWTFVAEVAGFATEAFEPVEIADAAPKTSTRFLPGRNDPEMYLEIATPHFEVVVRRDSGIITSLVDRRRGVQLVGWGMRRSTDYGDAARPDLGLNVFQLAHERPHFLAAWQMQEIHSERFLIDGATTEIVEQGPVRTVVRSLHSFGSSQITSDLVFYSDLDRIDGFVAVDWHEDADYDIGIPNLKLSFTPTVESGSAWFETPFGAVERAANGQNNPALRWVDVSNGEGGVAIMNDSIYGHDILGSRIRLNLLRTSYMPDPRSDEGIHNFRFSIVPHPGGWRDARIPARAAAFNQPLLVTAGTPGAKMAGSGEFAVRPQVSIDGLARVTMRPQQSGTGVVLRISESGGQEATVAFAGLPDGSVVRQADIVERPGSVLGRGPEFDLRLGSFQVITLIIEPG